MHETQILSTLPEVPPLAPKAQEHARVLVFDACELGVVLRAVLFVELVLAVGAMFGAQSTIDWLERLSLLTGGALPATLAWLVAACCAKRLLARLAVRAQYLAGVLLGGLAGLSACAMLTMVAVVQSPPWWASRPGRSSWYFHRRSP